MTEGASGLARNGPAGCIPSGAFAVVVDPRHRQFEENWPSIANVLKDRAGGISQKEIADYWPPDMEKPSVGTLYLWMGLAHDRKLVRREGRGTRVSPWLYRLPNEDDQYYDRVQLPPLRPLN